MCALWLSLAVGPEDIYLACWPLGVFTCKDGGRNLLYSALF